MFLNPVEMMCVRCHRISKCHKTYVCQLENERVRLPFQPFSKNGRLHEATVGYTHYSLHDQSFFDLFPSSIIHKRKQPCIRGQVLFISAPQTVITSAETNALRRNGESQNTSWAIK